MLFRPKEFNKINNLRTKLDLDKSIKLLGHVAYENLINYYQSADIFVLPSLHESFGKVLLEAGISAKPVVASATTGAKEIIKNKKTGYLVPINNQKKFVDKVLKLLKNDQLAKKMGQTAFAYVKKNFNYQDNVKNIISYWQKIITNARAN